jgi:hypothetical protein
MVEAGIFNPKNVNKYFYNILFYIIIGIPTSSSPQLYLKRRAFNSIISKN